MEILRVREEFVQCGEKFTFGSRLLIMTKYLATVKEKKCDII